MSFETLDNIMAYVKAAAFKVGNAILDSTGIALNTVSAPLYVDSSSKLAVGGFPFPLQLFAGVTSTASAVATIEGSSTGTANDLMHLTLVKGSNVTTFTSQGFARVTVTDDAGNITNGDYYVQFGTLS